MYRRLILLSVLLVGTHCFAAEDGADPYDRYEEKSDYNEALETPWVEIETQVNKLPKEDELVQIELRSLPIGMTMFLDVEHATLSDDRVTRLWIVVKSSSGSYNGSYEALRCETNEYKVYAYGNPKRAKPVRTVNLPNWRGIRLGNYRNELMFDYICDGVTQRPLGDVKTSLSRNFTEDDTVNELDDF